jgi:hypothetical protein
MDHTLLRLVSTVLLLATCNGTAIAAPSPRGPPGPALEPCSQTLYQFLPGDVNYCLARQRWFEGRYEEAEEMLALSASWGSKPAQYALGVAYFNGDKLARNRPVGLAWLALAAERRQSTYLGTFRWAYENSSPAERDAAQVEFAELRLRYRDDIAAVRADRRFRRALATLKGNEAYNRNVCIRGLNADATQTSNVTDISCPTTTWAVRKLEKRADAYFSEWKGRVEVGRPQTVPED